MNDLQRMLTGADPVADDPELRADDALAMRRIVLSAARVQRPLTERWTGFLPIAVAVIIAVAAGVALGLRVPEHAVVTGTAVVPLGSPAERRQLHFATPGGTRIIWTLDPQFELRGTTP